MCRVSLRDVLCMCWSLLSSTGMFAVDCQEYFVKWHAVGGQRFDGVDRETAVAAIALLSTSASYVSHPQIRKNRRALHEQRVVDKDIISTLYCCGF